MRLQIHGVGTLCRGADEPFGEGLLALEEIPIKDYTRPAFRRRFGRLSKLSYIAAARALEDAGVEEADSLGLVSSTALGEATVSIDLLSQIHASRGATLRPGLVPNSVHNAPAGYLTIGHGNHSPSVTVSQGWLSAEAALAAAEDLLTSTDVDRVLVVSGDEVDPGWTTRLEGANAGELASLLADEQLQEGAVALVVGAGNGGRDLGSLRAAVERAPLTADGVRTLLTRYGAIPAGDAEIRIRSGAGGEPLRAVVAAALDRPTSALSLDGPGPGTAQAAALSSLARRLEENRRGETLLVATELDELAFVHWVG